MKIMATADNVIIEVKKEKKSADELLIDTGEKEKILLGKIVACGLNANLPAYAGTNHTACVYKSRVAILPWESEESNFYVVKAENIYGILED